MTDAAAVPIVVLSTSEEDSELVSKTLRNAGQAAHCRWIVEVGALPGVLGDPKPELLILFANRLPEALPQTVALRNRRRKNLPIVVLDDNVDEDKIAAAMAAGAQDLVGRTHIDRFTAVALRELQHCRGARQLSTARASMDDYQSQLEALVKDSQDPICDVQEGIIVGTNPALHSLLGIADGELTGTPIMDVLHETDQAAVKGALSACLLGKWSGKPLRLQLPQDSGRSRSLDATLELASYDGEPCVRVSFKKDSHSNEKEAQRIAEERERHPLTGFYRRQRFLLELQGRLDEESKGGQKILAYIKPDEITNVREMVGPIASDDLLLEFARMIQELVKPNDLYGQFGGDLFMVLMSRGTARDAVVWAEQLRTAVAKRVFEVADKSISVTCSIGLACFDADEDSLESLVRNAQLRFLDMNKCGGNKVSMHQTAAGDETRQHGDTRHVRQIKTALMSDNFRLVYQPVASLQGKSQQMFDTLLRMLDENNREVLPGQFLPPAKRNGLMKNIDRWVIANAAQFSVEQNPTQLFIRLSRDSIPDTTLPRWLAGLLKERRVQPSKLIFQLTEQDVEELVKDAKRLASEVRAMGCRVAIEHFGVGHRPLQVLEHIEVDYVKIDGSLMEGLVRDKEIQQRVGGLIDAAKAAGIETVAERVEDANTMAVLWQLGVEFIQGYYVQGPEEIILESA